MNELQIKHALDFITNNETPGNVTFGCVRSADELTEVNIETERFVFVANTIKRSKNLGHWIVIEIQNSNKVEFFDSFGNPPEGLIADFISKFKVSSYNSVTLQHSESQACGSYCIYYAFMRYKNKSQNEIVKDLASFNVNKYGTSPSEARDFDLQQSIFSYFKIPIIPLNSWVLYSWHLYSYFYLPMVEDEIKHALWSITKYKTHGSVTIGKVLRADELNEINLELERVVYVVNTRKRGENLGRWVLIEVENLNQVEYFDSLGNLPEGQIADFISKFKYTSYNSITLQHHETMADGAYCVYYAFMRYESKSKCEIINTFISKYQNKYGTSPSIPRDFKLYYHVFYYTGIPIIPFEKISPLYWHMHMPMDKDQIKHALESAIKYKTHGSVTIGKVLRADDLNEINLELEKIVYIINITKRGEELGRWVLIEIENCNKVEFFDPLGIPPADTIADFISKFKVFSYNIKTLQDYRTKADGAYCIFYAFMRYTTNKSQTEIVNIFVSNYKNRHGILPSMPRDFEFYQNVFSSFRIPMQ